jgi:hypothetical protein
MNNWCFVGFLHIFLLGILIFKGLTARRLYKSFGVKGLIVRLLLSTQANIQFVYITVYVQSLVLNVKKNRKTSSFENMTGTSPDRESQFCF